MGIMTRSRSCALRAQNQHLTLNINIKQEPETLPELEMPPKGKRSGRQSQSPPPAASPEGAKKTAGRKGIRPVDRVPMKSWLRDKLDQRELPGQLWWKEGEEGRVFCVRWPHAARQGYNASEDAKLYKAWAKHSGIFRDGDEEDHKKWKSNFRCAIHSLPDVEELTAPGQKKGSGAVRTYKFLDKPRDKKNKKRKCFKQESTSSSSSGESCESDVGGSPSPSTATAEPSFSWPEGAHSPVYLLQQENQAPTIVFQNPNIPNLPFLGFSGNFQTVNRTAQSGGTFTVSSESLEDGAGGPGHRPIISYKIQPCTPISQELLESIEEVQDVTEEDMDAEEEVEEFEEVKLEAEEGDFSQMVQVGLPPLHNYLSQQQQQQPAARTRTPSGDSGHPDSPQSTDSVLPPMPASLFGEERVLFHLQEGCLLKVSETGDEGIEVSFFEDSFAPAAVAVEEVQTLNNEFDYTGLVVEPTMDTL